MSLKVNLGAMVTRNNKKLNKLNKSKSKGGEKYKEHFD
jgi:hypothetical protein